jgi:hypothetical protein
VSITQPEMDALVRLKLLKPELRHDRPSRDVCVQVLHQRPPVEGGDAH